MEKQTTQKRNPQQNKSGKKKNKNKRMPTYSSRGKLVGYKVALLCPELNIKAQVPRMVPEATVPIHRSMTVPIATNASGNMGWSWAPQLLMDNTAGVNGTTLALSGCTNSVSTTAGVYSLTAGASTSIGQSLNYSIISGTIKAFRLVSACIEVEPLGNVLQNSGIMSVGVFEHITASKVDPASAAVTDGTIPITSNLRNQKYHAVGNINRGEKVRAIWMPNETDDFHFYPINECQYSVSNKANTTVLAGTIIGTTQNGTPGSTSFNLNVHMNFEVIPAAGTNQSGQEELCMEDANPHDVIREVKSIPGAVARIVKN